MKMLLRFETVYLLLCALIASYTVASNVDISPCPDKSKKRGEQSRGKLFECQLPLGQDKSWRTLTNHTRLLSLN